jgi:hypothetical protein
VQQGALQLIHRCRRSDGGYTTRPEAPENITRSSAADVTAIAVRALCAIDATSSEFLAAHLGSNTEEGHGRVGSALFVSSTLMDWEPCMAPWFVVNAVRQLVQQEAEVTWEQAGCSGASAAAGQRLMAGIGLSCLALCVGQRLRCASWRIL